MEICSVSFSLSLSLLALLFLFALFQVLSQQPMTHSSTMGRNLELPITEPFLAAAALLPSPLTAAAPVPTSFRLLNA